MDAAGRRPQRPLLARPLPPSLASRVVILQVGDHAVDPTAWRDAIVEVEAGEIVLELADGGSLRFQRGDVLWFAGLPLRAVRNPGPALAVLIAVWRDPTTR